MHYKCKLVSSYWGLPINTSINIRESSPRMVREPSSNSGEGRGSNQSLFQGGGGSISKTAQCCHWDCARLLGGREGIIIKLETLAQETGCRKL